MQCSKYIHTYRQTYINVLYIDVCHCMYQSIKIHGGTKEVISELPDCGRRKAGSWLAGSEMNEARRSCLGLRSWVDVGVGSVGVGWMDGLDLDGWYGVLVVPLSWKAVEQRNPPNKGRNRACRP